MRIGDYVRVPVSEGNDVADVGVVIARFDEGRVKVRWEFTAVNLIESVDSLTEITHGEYVEFCRQRESA